MEKRGKIMANNNIAEGMGKKIVEALKQQSEIEIQNVVENPVNIENNSFEESQLEYNFEDEDNAFDNIQTDYKESTSQTFSTPEIMTFNQTAIKENFETEEIELPNNVAVLRQLINQLPAGVSKQTGAQIIKQTMEALGISMKSVLQEAQQVQENINNTTRECQASIIEHKKQINSLERQSQKLQRQYTLLNDIISLFVQTNI